MSVTKSIAVVVWLGGGGIAAKWYDRCFEGNESVLRLDCGGS